MKRKNVEKSAKCEVTKNGGARGSCVQGVALIPYEAMIQKVNKCKIKLLNNIVFCSEKRNRMPFMRKMKGNQLK